MKRIILPTILLLLSAATCFAIERPDDKRIAIVRYSMKYESPNWRVVCEDGIDAISPTGPFHEGMIVNLVRTPHAYFEWEVTTGRFPRRDELNSSTPQMETHGVVVATVFQDGVSMYHVAIANRSYLIQATGPQNLQKGEEVTLRRKRDSEQWEIIKKDEK